ncbi:hypothetical protein EV182_005757, partial [Spiromyces aspiralis]
MMCPKLSADFTMSTSFFTNVSSQPSGRTHLPVDRSPNLLENSSSPRPTPVARARGAVQAVGDAAGPWCPSRSEGTWAIRSGDIEYRVHNDIADHFCVDVRVPAGTDRGGIDIDIDERRQMEIRV